MKTFFPLIVAAASPVLLVGSCDPSDDSRRDDAGLMALGIHSAKAHGKDIKSITMVREIDGVRTEWMKKETYGGDIVIHIELGLPDKTMRLAMAATAGPLHRVSCRMPSRDIRLSSGRLQSANQTSMS